MSSPTKLPPLPGHMRRGNIPPSKPYIDVEIPSDGGAALFSAAQANYESATTARAAIDRQLLELNDQVGRIPHLSWGHHKLAATKSAINQARTAGDDWKHLARLAQSAIKFARENSDVNEIMTAEKLWDDAGRRIEDRIRAEKDFKMLQWVVHRSCVEARGVLLEAEEAAKKRREELEEKKDNRRRSG